MKSLRQRHRSCCKDKKKLSEGTAVKIADAMQVTYNTQFRAYQCRWCGWWHVGRPINRTPEVV